MRARPVQLRLTTKCTSEEYVKQQGWLGARLLSCPLHRGGGCGLARHTSYARAEPPGAWVARYYCPTGHRTFSLLPDCLASRLSSSLDEVEQVVAAVEAAGSVREAAAVLRPEIGAQGAERWVRRRVRGVAAAVVTVVGLLPVLLAGRERSIQGLRAALEETRALAGLREAAAEYLGQLPPPVGLGPRPKPRPERPGAIQQSPGPDPPEGSV